MSRSHHKHLALALAAVMAGGAVAPAVAQQRETASRPAAQVRLNVGDVVHISLPGEEAFNNPFQIDREGSVDLPEVGRVELAGLTVPQARDKVRSSLAAGFRDLNRFNLTLRERRLLITVGGYVRTPGQVELPGGANVQQAINSAGGLSPGAQLDRVQVRRGQQVITFDYKRYLDSGDGRILPVLRPLDEVFVPASPLTGNVEVPFDARTLTAQGDAAEDRSGIRVFGEVNQPGSFAFRQGMTPMDAIMRAGGVTRYASTERIRLIRGSGDPSTFNLKAFLDSGNAAMNQPLPPGTTIYVSALTDEPRQGPGIVYIMGEVGRPGAQEMRANAGFLDILANAGGPTRFADTRQARILRANGTVEPFDFGAYAERGSVAATLPTVAPGDAIFIPEKLSGEANGSWLRTPTDRAVRVLGAVRSPGRYEWSNEMSLLDLLAQANGPSANGDVANLQILTSDSNGRPIKFDLQRFLERGGAAGSLPQIRGGMTITVPELPVSPTDSRSQWVRQSADRSIYVMGAVQKPGRYAFDPNLSFLDIMAAVDGPTSAADLLNLRVNHRGEGRDRVSRVNLARYFETGDESLLPRVRPGDVIFVPDRNRNWLEQSSANTVRVLGAVGKPGRYQFSDGMNLLDLLAEAGGPNANALQERIVVVNMSSGGNNEARSFDLAAFARSGDFSKLPVVRSGDTVYIPNQGQSDWRIFMDGVRDVVSVLAIVRLFSGSPF